MRWWTANPNGTHQSFAKKYNDDWDEWIFNNPRASSTETLDFGRSMLRKYTITD